MEAYLGFMERFRRSWELGKASWQMLRSNPQFLLFPMVSTVAAVVVAAILGIGGFLAIPDFSDRLESSGNSESWPVYALMVAIVLAGTIITIYFNTALAAAVMQEMDGQDATFKSGLAAASQRKGTILQWAVISTTVGLILSALRERGGIAGNIASAIGGIAWGLATFFVIPILAARNVGPIDAVKESASLLRRTWGEQVIGGAGVGLFGFIITLPIIIVAIAVAGVGIASGSLAVAIPTIGIGLALGLVAIAVMTSLSSIFRTVVYRWATEHEVAPGYESGMLQHAFAPK